MSAGTVNKAYFLKEYPQGFPTPDTFYVKELPIPAVPEKGFLVRVHYVSVDPYMRGRMNQKNWYASPFALDAPIGGGGLGEVIESNYPEFKVGDLVAGFTFWQQYVAVTVSDQGPQGWTKVQPGIPPEAALSILGMTGLTAYFGLDHIGPFEEGKTLVVSGAAGAVGQVVVQLGKKKGLRVVAVAGGESKIKYVKGLGADEAIDYKAAPTREAFRAALAKAAPNGVDYYFENVGGYIGEETIRQLNKYGKVTVCGLISAYNDGGKLDNNSLYPQELFFSILTRELTVRGFTVSSSAARFPEALVHLSGLYLKGELKGEVSVANGFDKITEAFIGLFKGENLGKQLVKIV